MATPSTVFTELVTSTDRHWGRGVTDNVSKHNGLMSRLKKKGNIQTVSGGYEIAERLEYAENSTYQRFSGYDALNTNASTILTSAKYPLQSIALHITASGTELRMNSGKEAMVNLIDIKKKNALRTAANQFSVDLYSSGALPRQINGLQNIIQTNGQGTVGGIDSGTWTFWRNKFREATGTNAAATPSVSNSVQFLGDMNYLWLQTTRGSDSVDLIVMSHDFFALYEVSQQDKQRYSSSDMAEAGFVSYKYKTADVIFDDNANFATTAETAYFLNTDYLFIKQHREAKWTMDSEKTPINQDAVVIPIYWMGNLVCTNRALQGRLFDAA